MPVVFPDLDTFSAAVGQPLGTSSWFQVTQGQVNLFAEATGDHQWIHVDPERAADGPFGTTIAHGYLTLSLVPILVLQIFEVHDVASVVNYGAEKLRFPHPVTVGSRIRATATLTGVTPRATGTQALISCVVEIEDVEKPACVVDVVFVYTPA